MPLDVASQHDRIKTGGWEQRDRQGKHAVPKGAVGGKTSYMSGQLQLNFTIPANGAGPGFLQ